MFNDWHCTLVEGQACRKLAMEESPSEPPVKKKRPAPKTSRPKKKKTDTADRGGGGDAATPQLSMHTFMSCSLCKK